MEKIFGLPQEYVNLGFELSNVGDKFFALKYLDTLIFVFGSGIDAREDFISRLCDCHLKLAARENSENKLSI